MNKPAAESLNGECLSRDAWDLVRFALRFLKPLRDAQLAIEGDKYSNAALYVLGVFKTRKAIDNARVELAEEDSVASRDLGHSLHRKVAIAVRHTAEMFQFYWQDSTDPFRYQRDPIKKGEPVGRFSGVHPVFWTAYLCDPRTKQLTRHLSKAQYKELWEKFEADLYAKVSAGEQEMPLAPELDEAPIPARRGQRPRNPNDHVEMFDDVDDMVRPVEPMEMPTQRRGSNLRALLKAEVAMYMTEPGVPMKVEVVTENGHSVHQHSDPYKWWRMNQSKYKNIARYLARPSLATQSTSASSERTFSKAGLIVTKLRNRLDPTWVEQLILLDSYFKYRKNNPGDDSENIYWLG